MSGRAGNAECLPLVPLLPGMLSQDNYHGQTGRHHRGAATGAETGAGQVPQEGECGAQRHLVGPCQARIEAFGLKRGA